MLLQPASAHELGKGRPHSESPIFDNTSQLPPTIKTLCEMQRQFLYVVSLEFALGNLDALQAQEAPKGNEDHDEDAEEEHSHHDRRQQQTIVDKKAKIVHRKRD